LLYPFSGNDACRRTFALDPWTAVVAVRLWLQEGLACVLRASPGRERVTGALEGRGRFRVYRSYRDRP